MMKKGNVVWSFSNGVQKIMAESVAESIELGNGNVWLATRTRCGLLNRDFFPTREALCEHYRKIFE